MRIVIDDQIPYINGVLEPFAEVVYLPGGKISKQDVQHADALIVRTRTICNASLLEGTSVRFIATATIGYDHIDTAYCKQKGIAWTNAAGCNAQSVAQYIASALVALSLKYKFDLSAKTIGIVGVGNVGRQVARISGILGMNILLNDPPREDVEGAKNFVSLDQIKEEADIITFHVPLTQEGKHKTAYLADTDFFDGLEKNPIIINSARGGILNEKSLFHAIKEKKLRGTIIDCWENEPDVNMDLLKYVDIATPHIAGYSADGKANATSMSVQAISRFFHFGLDNWLVSSVPTPENPVINMEKEDIVKAVLHSYNVRQDDCRLRENPLSFETLRGDYPLRREYSAYQIKGFYSEKLEKLGFRFVK